MPKEPTRDPNTATERPAQRPKGQPDDAPDAARDPSSKSGQRARPVDLTDESAAGEEDPGAGLDVAATEPARGTGPDKV